jgi:hypothetical protein
MARLPNGGLALLFALHPTLFTGVRGNECSSKSRYKVLHSASLLNRGSDSSSGPTLLVVGTSGSPVRDGRCSRVWKQVEDGA